jgi:hypothetical protein
MVEQERIIELDGSDLLDEPEGLPPSRIRSVRRIGFAALALVCLAAFGGAARPPAPTLSPLGSITWPSGLSPSRQPPMLASGLVMAELGDQVLAYHPDGRLAWRAPLKIGPALVRSSSIAIFDDGIVLTRGALRLEAQIAQSQGVVSVGLDPATGRERWRIEGTPYRVGDFVLVTENGEVGPTRWRIYRRLPDDLLWTVPPARAIETDLATDSLMTLTDEGLFTEYQLSTGKPRRSAKLTVPRLDPAADTLTIQVTHDRLTFRAMRFIAAETSTQTLSYDRASLQPSAAQPLDRFTQVVECGPVICGLTYERTYILDRDSLAELWHTQRGEYLVWTGTGLLRTSDPARLLDERTGQVRLEADGWTTVFDFLWTSARPMPVHLIQQVGQRTFVARLTPQGIRVLGSIPQPVRDCQVHDGLLACTTQGSRTGVWRLGDS